ncbi:hypothetical protein Pint_14453 [Pistacia integerrima]|uniref:Uncharacterized protein n=1 Tax=Pistacia integerrima TaxID=434235 RepID=A0ACC0Y6L0_9ROSI|nr:hypothetical protein Pint_14453 [Pistacia integerrima]
MGVAVLSGEEAMEMELETEKNKTKKDVSSEVVRWERFLPRMVLRVLLVEADDSTRHIIFALLKKCSYGGITLVLLFFFIHFHFTFRSHKLHMMLMVVEFMFAKTAQAWFIRCLSTANSNDHRQKPLSLLADWNSYAFSQESDSSTFNLEAAVCTTTDKVSGTFSVCDEFERLSGFCSLVALLVLTCSMLFLQNGGGADEKLEDSGKSTSEIDLRVALGPGCVQWRRNHN